MSTLEVMIVVIAAGFLLLVTGYGNRDRELGIYTIALGVLLMFGAIIYKFYLEFGV